MKVISHKLKFPKSGPTELLAASCWHLGQPAVHQEGIELFMEKAKTHSWIHHGDILEGITPYDKRFEADAHSECLLNTMQRAKGILSTANKTCIGIIKGNHENAPSRSIGDAAEDIAIAAKVPYLGAVCFARLECPKGELTAFFCHGNGTANYRTGEPERKTVNQKIKLRDILKHFDADICGMGHLHKGIVTAPCFEHKLCLEEDDKVKRRAVETRSGWYYACPSMFRTYNTETDTSNYGEMALYPSTDIGWIEVVIDRDGTIALIREVYEDGSTKNEVTPEVVS